MKHTDDDINIKNDSQDQEACNITVVIKQEPELILESEYTWFPTKLEDEQQEYYQQYCHNDDNEEENKGIQCILPTMMPDKTEYEEYSIKFIDDNAVENSSDDDHVDGNSNKADVSYKDDDTEDDTEDDKYSDDEDENDGDGDDKYSDEDDDNDSDNYNVNIDISSYMDITKNLDINQETKDKFKDLDDNVAASGSGTKPIYQQNAFFNWLSSKYIQYVCPICKDKFINNTDWEKHINEQHKKVIDDTKSSNYFITSTQSICKQCQKRIKNDIAILIHTMRHKEKDTLQLFVCNICNFKFFNMASTQNHVIKEHPNIVESFENLKIDTKSVSSYKCPSCPAIYKREHCLSFHFKDNHPKEYSEIFIYPCHLCKHNIQKFDNLQDFLKHLLEEHNLKDLKLMNFKVFTKNIEGQHFYCTKCFKLYTEMDLIKFVRHYLEHDSRSFRYCKTCHKKFAIKYHNWFHMCNKLFNKYQAYAEKTIKNIHSVSTNNKVIKELTNWKDFEEYIKHICPFCNKEFESLQHWQMHLRKTHHLDTLKGLKMKQIAKDTHKLQCNVCHTLVNNKSVELHTHCFQHLTFKPYKCRHCSLQLNNYKLALNHVLNKCQESIEQNNANALRESFEIICPLCKEIYPNTGAVLKHYTHTHKNFLNYYTQQKDNTLICNICQVQLADKKKLYRFHVLQHFDQKLFKCRICSKSLPRSIIAKHTKYHFAIPINIATSENTKSLNNSHFETFSIAKNRKAEGGSVLNEFSEFILFACPECNESLANQQLWLDHINDKHDFFQKHNLCIKDPQDGLLKCIHCKKTVYNSQKDRQKHKLTHMPHKAFICSVCYHRCNSLGVLYGHLRRIHFAKGSYNCSICSEVYPTQYHRAEHIKIAHPKSEWPASMCLICYKIVRQMKVHLLTHDINRPKFECEYCGVKIVTLQDFNKHKARHEAILATEKTTETYNAVTLINNVTTENSSTEDATEQKTNAATQAAVDDNLPKEKLKKRKSNTKSTNAKKKTKNDTKSKT